MQLRHTMVRTVEMSRSLAFYTNVLGMAIKDNTTYTEPPLQIAFLYAKEDGIKGPFLEITCDPKVRHFNTDKFKGHISFLVPDISSIISRVAERGGKIIFQPSPTLCRRALLTIFEDPDGNEVELIQKLAS